MTATTDQTILETQTEPPNTGLEQGEISAFIGPDGALLDGWKDRFVPAELRKEKLWDNFKDIGSILKTTVHQSKRMAEKGVFPPDDKSTPEEIAAYRKAIGVPDKPEDYKMADIPPELKEYYADPLIVEANGELNKAHLTQKQYDIVMALDRKRLELSRKALVDSEAQQEQAAEKTINEQFGQNKEVMVHLNQQGFREITKNWPQEKRESLHNELNNTVLGKSRPLMFEFLAGVGELCKEGSASDVEGQAQTALSEITKLESSEAYMTKSHKDHQVVIDQLEVLYKKANSGK